MTASTFDNNNANDAGAIYVLPSQLSNLINDTFVGDVARTQGGALDVHNFGTVILANDTITGNTAATGGGVAVLQQSISAVLLENDIVALNTAPTSPDIATLAFIIEDAGGNFIGNLSGANGFHAGTLTGNPKVGLLQNNGGPLAGVTGYGQVVATQALLIGSPAIGAGVSNGTGQG